MPLIPQTFAPERRAGFLPQDFVLSGLTGLHVVVGENNAGKSRLLASLMSGTFEAEVALSPFVTRADVSGWEEHQFVRESKAGKVVRFRWPRNLSQQDLTSWSQTIASRRFDVVEFPYPGDHQLRDIVAGKALKQVVLRPASFVHTQRYFGNSLPPNKSLVNVMPTVEALIPWLDAHKGHTNPDFREKFDRIAATFKELADLDFAVFNDDTGKVLGHLIDSKGTERVLDECGDGLRDLLCIVTEVIARPTHDLLLDEPGLRLHPKLQRRLLRFLERQASDRAIWIATHDGVIVGDAAIKSHTLVQQKEGKTVVDAIPTLRERRRALALLGWQPGDAILSETLLLCEGPSDRIAFEAAIERLGVSGVAVADLGGSGVVWDSKHDALARRIDVAKTAAPYMRAVALLDSDGRPERHWRKLTAHLTERAIAVSKLRFKDLETVWIEAGLVGAILRAFATEASRIRGESIAPPNEVELAGWLDKYRGLAGCALLEAVASEAKLRVDKELAAQTALATIDLTGESWRTFQQDVAEALKTAVPWQVN